VIVGGAVSLPVYGGVLHLLAPGLLARLRAMAFPRASAPETARGHRESAIAAGEPDAMVRPTTLLTPD
jgi:hypothetical protein